MYTKFKSGPTILSGIFKAFHKSKYGFWSIYAYKKLKFKYENWPDCIENLWE